MRKKTYTEAVADFLVQIAAGATQPHMQTPCKVWTGKRHGPMQYGTLWFLGKQRAAHRVAYSVFVGEIPDGRFVLHRCDNPPCVNPEHLYLGDHQQNCADRMARGRWKTGVGERHGTKTHPESTPRGDRHHARRTPEVMARGERHGTKTRPEKVVRGEKHTSARLSEQQVRDIRARFAAGERRSDLATEYAVSWQSVDALVHRRTWRHI